MENKIKIKFPAASIIVILAALYSFFAARTSRAPLPIAFELVVVSFLIHIFLAVVLLLKKRGVLLTVAVCAWAGMAILVMAKQSIILNMYGRSHSSVINLLQLFSHLLLIGFAICCNFKKGPEHMRKLVKLWFVPGAVRALVSVIQFSLIRRAIGISFDSAAGFVIPDLFSIAAFLSLGYWIAYIYSLEPATKKAPKVCSGHLPDNGPPPMAASAPAQGFCGACGAQVIPGNAFCPSCGNKLASHAAASAPDGNTSYNAPGYVHDAPSTGFAVLGGFIPVVGLILYLVWRESLPLRARSAGKGAIIGVISYVALIILLYTLYFMFLMSLFS